MASLQYVLEEGSRDGWFESLTIIVLIVVGGIALVTFVVHELETKNLVVDLSVFANRSYAAATGLNFMVGMSLFPASFLFSLYCGVVMHYTALDIGMLFLQGSFIQLLLLPVIGKAISRVDPRPVILYGGVTMVMSLWMNARLTQQADTRALVMPLFVPTCGLGFIFAPLNVTALSDLPANRRGNGAGLFNLTRELGGSIDTAWMSTMLDRHVKECATSLSAHVSACDPTTQEQLALLRANMAGKAYDTTAGALGVLNLRVLTESLVRAFNQGFLMLGIVFAVCLALVLLLRRPRGGAAPDGAHELGTKAA